ncbi:hypothetical protein T4E_5080 [Trichinella pseudospiralis]|uniref:Uncharacterized protein n=1 Tax=Trichinella pseudospiralis TaxID=6337 RepID=A0A0V0YN41_TRIPS|nr:hypothetical protein T4E_5080 [Trichinella pseudospiralis]
MTNGLLILEPLSALPQIAPKGVVILNDKMIYVVGIGTIDAEVYNIFLQVDYISPQRYSPRTRVLYSVLGQFIRRPWIHNCHRQWKHQLVDDQQEEVLSDTNLTIYILYLFVSSHRQMRFIGTLAPVNQS